MWLDGSVPPIFRPLIGWAVGMDWPEAEESKLFALADVLAGAAYRIARGSQVAGGVPVPGADVWEGEALKAFVKNTSAKVGGSQADLLGRLAAMAVALNDLGVQVQYTKRMITLMIYFLTFQLITLMPAIMNPPTAVVAMRAALWRTQFTRAAIQQLAKRLLFNIALFGGLMGGMELYVQNSQNRREHIDWSQVLTAMRSGALNGVFLTAGTWVRPPRTLRDFMVISGIAGMLTDGTVQVVDGQPFNLTQFLKAGTSGAIGAADAHWAGGPRGSAHLDDVGNGSGPPATGTRPDTAQPSSAHPDPTRPADPRPDAAPHGAVPRHERLDPSATALAEHTPAPHHTAAEPAGPVRSPADGQEPARLVAAGLDAQHQAGAPGDATRRPPASTTGDGGRPASAAGEGARTPATGEGVQAPAAGEGVPAPAAGERLTQRQSFLAGRLREETASGLWFRNPESADMSVTGDMRRRMPDPRFFDVGIRATSDGFVVGGFREVPADLPAAVRDITPGRDIHIGASDLASVLREDRRLADRPDAAIRLLGPHARHDAPLLQDLADRTGRVVYAADNGLPYGSARGYLGPLDGQWHRFEPRTTEPAARGGLGDSVAGGVRHLRTLDVDDLDAVIVTFNDGTTAARFTGETANRVEAAAMVRQATGVDGPRVHRVGDEVYQEYGAADLARSAATGIRRTDLYQFGDQLHEVVTFNDGRKAFRIENATVVDADLRETSTLPPYRAGGYEGTFHRASETVIYEAGLIRTDYVDLQSMVRQETDAQRAGRALYYVLTHSETFDAHAITPDGTGRHLYRVPERLAEVWEPRTTADLLTPHLRADGVPSHFTLGDNQLSRSDLAARRAALEELRPEFARRGWLDWHDGMMQRLDYVERHAVGQTPLLGPIDAVPAAPRQAPEPLWRQHDPAAGTAKEALASVLHGDGLRQLNETLAGHRADAADPAGAEVYAQRAAEYLAGESHRQGTVQVRVPAELLPDGMRPGAEVTFRGLLDGVNDPRFLPDLPGSVQLTILGRTHAYVGDVSGRPHHVLFGPNSPFKVLAVETTSYGAKHYFLVEQGAGGAFPHTGRQQSTPPARPDLTGQLRDHVTQHREETPSGVWYRDLNHPDDLELAEAARGQRPIDGAFVLMAHGEPDRMFIGGHELNGDHVATLLLNEPRLRPDDVVVLGSCEVGKGDAPLAQTVANRTGRVVIAPDSVLVLNEFLDRFSVRGDDIDLLHTLDRRGGWRIFLPDDQVPGHVWERVKDLTGGPARGADPLPHGTRGRGSSTIESRLNWGEPGAPGDGGATRAPRPQHEFAQEAAKGITGAMEPAGLDSARATLKDGSHTLVMDFATPEERNAKHLVSQLGQALGLKMPATHPVGRHRLLTEWIYGDPADMRWSGESWNLPGNVATRDGILAGLLATLIGDEPALRTALEGEPHLMPEPGVPHLMSRFFHRDTGSGQPTWAPNPLAPVDIATFRVGLRSLRPAFADAGLLDVHQRMTARLDHIAPNAISNASIFEADPAETMPSITTKNLNAWAEKIAEAAAGLRDTATPDTGRPPVDPARRLADDLGHIVGERTTDLGRVVVFADGSEALALTGRAASDALEAALTRHALGLDGPAVARAADGTVYQAHGSDRLRAAVATGIRDSVLMPLTEHGAEVVTLNDGTLAIRHEFPDIDKANVYESGTDVLRAARDGVQGTYRAAPNVVYEHRLSPWSWADDRRAVPAELHPELARRALHTWLTRPHDIDALMVRENPLLAGFRPGQGILSAADSAALRARYEALRPAFEQFGLIDRYQVHLDQITRTAARDPLELGPLHDPATLVPDYREAPWRPPADHVPALPHLLEGGNLRQVNELAVGRTDDPALVPEARAVVDRANAELDGRPTSDGHVSARVPRNWLATRIEPGQRLVFNGLLEGVDDPTLLTDLPDSVRLTIRASEYVDVSDLSGKPAHVLFKAGAELKVLAVQEAFGETHVFAIQLPEGHPAENVAVAKPRQKPALTGDLLRHFTEHVERTSAGVWLRDLNDPHDRKIAASARNVQPIDGAFYVDGHGSEHGNEVGSELLTSTDVAALLLNSPDLQSRDILLLANCEIGSGLHPQEVAVFTGHVVLAADSAIHVTDDGQMRAFSSQFGHLGGRGQFRIYLPDDPVPGTVYAKLQSWLHQPGP